MPIQIIVDIMLRPPSDFYVCQDSDYFNLEVKQSSLPIGEGLFSKRGFDSGQIIGEYRGVIIDAKYSNDKAYDSEDKMVSINSHYCVLGRNAVSKANDIVKFNPKNYMSQEYAKMREQKKIPDLPGLHRNSQIQVIQKDRVFLVATKRIEPGEQIYTDYGFEYWDFFLSRQYAKLHPGTSL